MSDFHALADIPCRKLVVLDTCHGGPLQPKSQGDAKVAARVLNENFVFTLTAAGSNETAVEPPGAIHGLFTGCLLEGLDKKADESGDRNGEVTLNEIITYVKQEVPLRAHELVVGRGTDNTPEVRHKQHPRPRQRRSSSSATSP